MGLRVIEVGRVNRQLRRRHGKTDTVDAESAARAVLAGDADGEPKLGDGAVERIRHLKIARDTAPKARTQADRKSDMEGKSVSVSVELWGRHIIKKKTKNR